MLWGFIGTGRIAERIMEAFRLLPQSRVVAAYSRNRDARDDFCRRWDIPLRCDSIEELASAPEVDILYLATPHIVHLEHFRLAAQASKPVLCEKPMAMSAAETREMTALAAQNGFFLMEGLWTRFFPLYDRLRELIQAGTLGRVYNVMADFSYHSPYDPALRFFRRDLGGGAMRGAGIYPLALATEIFGAMPCELQAMADVQNEVDLRSAALLRFPCGGMAQILSGFQGQSVQGASLAFERGSVWIPDFWHPDRAVIRRADGEETIRAPFEFPGFQYELMEVERCVVEGRLQSERMSWEESIGLSAALDTLYDQWQTNSIAKDR